MKYKLKTEHFFQQMLTQTSLFSPKDFVYERPYNLKIFIKKKDSKTREKF